MAKVLGGMLGSFSGKIGGVVGGRWKDIQYARGYVKPANPNTAGQQYYRGRFKEIATFALGILGAVLQTYMDKMVRGMSGYNWFIRKNTPAKTVDFNPALVVMTEGPLFPAVISSVNQYQAQITVAFAPGIGSNGLATDKVFAVAIDSVTGAFLFSAAEVSRSTGTIDILTATPDNLHDVWLITCRRDAAGSVVKVGTSQHYTAS
jgi:hypothetical protein